MNEHAMEARNRARGFENSVEHLQNVYARGTYEALIAIEVVIQNAQRQLDKLREILGDWKKFR